MAAGLTERLRLLQLLPRLRSTSKAKKVSSSMTLVTADSIFLSPVVRAATRCGKPVALNSYVKVLDRVSDQRWVKLGSCVDGLN